MPSLRQDGSTASGPSTSAGTPPALTRHNRTVPTRRVTFRKFPTPSQQVSSGEFPKHPPHAHFESSAVLIEFELRSRSCGKRCELRIRDSRPWLSAENARPAAGECPSRRRWQVRIWRLTPKLASSSASRATMSEARSLRIANGAVSEMGATVGFRKAVMARQSSLPTAAAGGALSANFAGEGREPADRLPTLLPPTQAGGVRCARVAASDVVGPQRREAVERHRRVGRRIRPGALDQHLVADLERHRQRVRDLLVHHVGGIAGRTREHARRHFRAVVRGADGVADRLVHGLGETAELADVEIHPAHLVLVALPGDQNDFGLDDARIADHAAARFDDGLRDLVAEMLAQRAEDRPAVLHDRRNLPEVFGRESATHVDHGEVDATLGTVTEYRRGHCQRAIPRLYLALLRADMERDSIGLE